MYRVVIRGDSMWPSLVDGDEMEFEALKEKELQIGDLVLFKHPFNTEITAVKRLVAMDGEKYILEGDNPDPTASQDSHNFGPVKREMILGFKRNQDPSC